MRKFFLGTSLVLFFAALFFAPPPARAAEIFFGVKTKNIAVGSVIEIGVFANTAGQEINTIGGDINYPGDILDVQNIYDGSSTMSLWVKRPAINTAGTVSFAGITPGGINSGKAYLFSVIFKAKQKGSATIAAKNEQLLLNDGQGREAALSSAPLTVSVTDAGMPSTAPPVIDQAPPELFTPQVAKTPDVFDGKWFVTFVAQDKGTGIDHYEIREVLPRFSFASLVFWPRWEKTEPPYELKDQNRASRIEVKAVDRAGNQRVVAIAPASQLPGYDNYLVWLAIGLMVAAIYRYWNFIKRSKN